MIAQNMSKLIDTTKENLENKIISLSYMKSKDQIANVLAKFAAFEGALCNLRIQDPNIQFEGSAGKIS